MALPVETLNKINMMSNEKIAIIVQVVDQLSSDSVEKFREIRKRSANRSLTDEEVDAFVDSVREERNAACS